MRLIMQPGGSLSRTFTLLAETTQDRMVLAAMDGLLKSTWMAPITAHVYTEGEVAICASTTRSDGQVMLSKEGNPPKVQILTF